MVNKQKICFVVMGFGKKTDYESGRLLDLDATYEAIIQPAVEDCGYRCIRANEVLHSGIIDLRMYEMLLKADLVVADISTGNVNAVYELGVRHALRPFSTIVMKEKKGKLHFDLDHTSTFMYEHLGDDIGHREAKRAQEELSRLIETVSKDPKTDSPVYTYIPFLKEPSFTDTEFEEILENAEEEQEIFSTFLDAAEAAADASNHREAMKHFNNLLNMRPDNSYLRQQTALHTYKSKYPSELLALIEALNILEPIEPRESNDPETLGLTGAIHKRLWKLNNDSHALDLAIHFYERGFILKGDYYNAENAATCYEIRSLLQSSSDEALFDQMSARKIRKKTIEKLLEVIEAEDFQERSDKLWIYATLANCHFALGLHSDGENYEQEFIALSPADWEKATYLSGKESALTYSKKI